MPRDGSGNNDRVRRVQVLANGIDILDRAGRIRDLKATAKERFFQVAKLYIKNRIRINLDYHLFPYDEPNEPIVKNQYGHEIDREEWRSVRETAERYGTREIRSLIREFQAEFNNRYPPRQSELGAPPGWMTNNQDIKAMLRRTKFWEVWKYLKDSKLPIAESIELAERIGAGTHTHIRGPGSRNPGEEIECRYVLARLDFWRHPPNSIGLAKSTIREYVNAFSREEIIKFKGRDGSNGSKVYALGYWLPVPNILRSGPKAIYFLKHSPNMRRKLANFRVRAR